MPRPSAHDSTFHSSGRGGWVRPRILLIACFTLLAGVGLALLIAHSLGQPVSVVASSPVPVASIGAPLIELDPARVRHPVALPLIPRPKSMRTTPGKPLLLSAGARILVATDAGRLLKQGAEELQVTLRKSKTCVPTVVPLHLDYGRERTGSGSAGVDIVVTSARSPLAASLHADVPTRPEGYWLAVEAGRVVVVGRDDPGAYWGVQTLEQLIATSARGIPCLQPVTIKDWPTRIRRCAA